jgi:hypothetical protein
MMPCGRGIVERMAKLVPKEIAATAADCSARTQVKGESPATDGGQFTIQAKRILA